MKYTNYIAALVKSSGIPHMDENAFSKVMNLVHLEGRIEGMVRLKNESKPGTMTDEYQLHIYRYNKQISDLTFGLEPSDFLKKVCSQ